VSGETILCRAVPTWGIVVIVIVVLLVLIFVAYLVRKLLSKKRHKGKDPKKGMKGAMDVKGVPMLGALTSKVRHRRCFSVSNSTRKTRHSAEQSKRRPCVIVVE